MLSVSRNIHSKLNKEKKLRSRKPEQRSSSPRSISIGQLNTLLHLHLRPIKLIVYKRPYQLKLWDI